MTSNHRGHATDPCTMCRNQGFVWGNTYFIRNGKYYNMFTKFTNWDCAWAWYRTTPALAGAHKEFVLVPEKRRIEQEEIVLRRDEYMHIVVEQMSSEHDNGFVTVAKSK